MKQIITFSVIAILFAFQADAQTNKIAKFTSTTMPSGLTQSLLFDNGINIGIGTTTPGLLLDLRGTPGAPTTTGIIQTNGSLRLRTNTANSQTLDMGIFNAAPYGAWLQATNSGDLSSNSPLILNPNGGNLGIGTTTPGAKLEVQGSIYTPGFLRFWSNDGDVVNNSSWYGLGMSNVSGLYSGYPAQTAIQLASFWGLILKTGNGQITMRGDNGNLGINTSSPIAKLQVQNGSVLFDGITGTTAISGAGTRMMWIPAKSAFRAGYVSGVYWDDVNIGVNSFATGYDAKASGQHSFAAGYFTTASAPYSTALGGGTTASGQASTAFGFSTIASGQNATAFGIQSIASGFGSFAVGSNTIASGENSSSFGNTTSAQSYNSFVLGAYNYNSGTYNATSWVATDVLFVIANGTSASTRSNAVTVLKNGNTGFGIYNPQYKLDVAGTVNATQFLVNGVPLGASAQWQLSGNNIYYNSGNVAIGTTPDANYKLVVCGPLRTQRVVVETFTCDFVFDQDYPLISLQERKEKVLKNKHLINIASAKEMDENGNDLGNTTMGILQNVEEHELYLYKHDDKIKSLEQENDQLKEQILSQKKMLEQQGKAIEELKRRMK